jgi:hypothetical protein
VPGKPDPAKMVPQRRKKTPSEFDPGHTAERGVFPGLRLQFRTITALGTTL